MNNTPESLQYQRKLYLCWVIAGVLVWAITITALVLINPESPTPVARFLVGCIMGTGGGFIGTEVINAAIIIRRLRKLEHS